MIVFFDEVEKGMGNSEVVKDKLTVEVDKVKERVYFLHLHGGWPGSNAIKFYWVHGKLSRFHDHHEVLYIGDTKLAFFEF